MLALATLVYARTLTFQFVHDDWTQIVANSKVQSWHHLLPYFTEHVWAHIYGYEQANYYRPLFMVWLLVNHTLFGLNPVGWHVTTLLAHLAATALVFQLGTKLLKDQWAAAIAASVFALHPVQVESVAWISGVSEPLLAITLLASFLSYLNYSRGEGRRYLFASVLAYFLALLCKETAVVLPLAIAAYAWFRPSETEPIPGRARNSVLAALSYAPVLVVYLVVRAVVLHSALQARFKISFATMLFTTPSLLWTYLSHLLAPFRLALNYDVRFVFHPGASNFVLPLILVFLVCCALWVWARRSQLAGFAIAWIFIFLLVPVASASVFIYFDLVHDRYLYLPGIGFALLVAAGWQRLSKSSSQGRAIQIVLAAVIIVVYGCGTLVAESYWRNNLALYRRAMEVAPRHFLPKVLTATALLQGGDAQKAEALPLLQEAARTSNGHWLALLSLGQWYYEMAQYDEAEKYYRQSIGANPHNPTQYYMLGETQLRLGKVQDALESFQRVVSMVPGNLNYRLRYGGALELSGDIRGALEQYQAVLAVQPGERILQDRVRQLQAKMERRSSDR